MEFSFCYFCAFQRNFTRKYMIEIWSTHSFSTNSSSSASVPMSSAPKIVMESLLSFNIFNILVVSLEFFKADSTDHFWVCIRLNLFGNKKAEKLNDHKKPNKLKYFTELRSFKLRMNSWLNSRSPSLVKQIQQNAIFFRRQKFK